MGCGKLHVSGPMYAYHIKENTKGLMERPHCIYGDFAPTDWISITHNLRWF